MDTDEKKLENENSINAPAKKGRDGTGFVSLSIVGALVGIVVGLIPVTAWTYVFKANFFPLYALCPLSAYLFMRLFRAEYDASSVMVLTFFSALGTYLALLSCQAAHHVISFKMSVLEIPILTILSFGKTGVIPPTASNIVFPAIFAALGIFVSIALLSLSRLKTADEEVTEVEANTENPR